MADKIKLGDILTVLTDYHANGAYKKLKENVELLDKPDYAVMIRTTNFESNDFSNNLKYINKSAYYFLSKSKVFPNDIIMNKIANAGSTYLMPDLGGEVSLAMNLFLLRVDQNLANPTYIYLYLKLNEAYVKSFANGSVTKTITKDAVRNLEIELPNRQLQNAIVERFNNLNDRIRLIQHNNQTLEQMAQALFKSWFVDFDPVVDNALAAGNPIPDELAHRVEVRRKAHALPDFQPLPEDIRSLFPSEFEQTDEPTVGIGGWVPKGWKIKKMLDVAKVTTGKRPPQKVETCDDENKVPVWGGNGVKWFTNDTLEKDDYIITGRVGTLGTVYKVSGSSWPSDNALVIKPREHYLFDFVFQALQRADLLNLNAGSTQPMITQTSLKQLTVLLPEQIDSVEAYQKLAQSYSVKIAANRKVNETLVKVRESLLPKLISGEIQLDSSGISIINEEAELQGV